jgi:hypothetical protein
MNIKKIITVAAQYAFLVLFLCLLVAILFAAQYLRQ